MRLTIGERACCSAVSGRIPSLVPQVNGTTSCLCSIAPRIPRRGQKLLTRCPVVETIVNNLRPSWAAVANLLKVGVKEAGCGLCFVEAMGTQRLPARGSEHRALLEEWWGTAMRRTAWIVARREISVIALTVEWVYSWLVVW